jgi:proline-specific peptidase
LSTQRWTADANALRAGLTSEVQRTLSQHEAAGTTDSAEYQEATEVFYERRVHGGDKSAKFDGCEGAPWNPVIYEYMWGPTEFHATGNQVDFDLTPRLHRIDVPVLFLAGEHDEARPETVAGFRQLIEGARFEVIPDAAHLTLARQPERYRRVLASFVDQSERTVAAK